MSQVLLGTSAMLYVGFGVWCTLRPRSTSSAIGFRLTNANALSEYAVVYGGLEIGLGVFFGVSSVSPALIYPGLLLACCTYGALATWRICTVYFVRGLTKFVYCMLSLEATLAIVSAVLLFLEKNKMHE